MLYSVFMAPLTSAKNGAAAVRAFGGNTSIARAARISATSQHREGSFAEFALGYMNRHYRCPESSGLAAGSAVFCQLCSEHVAAT